MSILEVHALFVGIPLGLVLILSLLIFTHKGKHPATYNLSEPWTHEPILWSAVDERIGDRHRDPQDLTVGGGASGKW